MFTARYGLIPYIKKITFRIRKVSVDAVSLFALSWIPVLLLVITVLIFTSYHLCFLVGTPLIASFLMAFLSLFRQISGYSSVSD